MVRSGGLDRDGEAVHGYSFIGKFIGEMNARLAPSPEPGRALGINIAKAPSSSKANERLAPLRQHGRRRRMQLQPDLLFMGIYKQIGVALGEELLQDLAYMI